MSDIIKLKIRQGHRCICSKPCVIEAADALAKAAGSMKWVCDELGYGRQRTPRDDAIRAMGIALAAYEKVRNK